MGIIGMLVLKRIVLTLTLSQPPQPAPLRCAGPELLLTVPGCTGTAGLFQVASLPSRARLVSSSVYSEGLTTVSTTTRFFAPMQTLGFLCFARLRNSPATVSKVAVCARRLLTRLFSSEWKHCLSKGSETPYRNNAMAAECPQSQLEQFCSLLSPSALPGEKFKFRLRVHFGDITKRAADILPPGSSLDALRVSHQLPKSGEILVTTTQCPAGLLPAACPRNAFAFHTHTHSCNICTLAGALLSSRYKL